MDFSNYKFRCSSLGAIMSDSKEGAGITDKQLELIKELQAKSQVKTLTNNQTDELLRLIAKRDAHKNNPLAELGDTCIAKLVEIYINARFGRRKDIYSKYLEKGIMSEEDSISLYSEVKKEPFFKNTTRFENDYITGEPDTFEVGDFHKHVIDFKSSWDLFTFFASKQKPLTNDYVHQLNGYAELCEADRGKLAYCLNNTPDFIIQQEIDRLRYKLGIIDPDMHPEFQAAAAAIRHNMIFDDIPKAERVHEAHVSRDRELIARVYKRIKLCRIWLNEFAYQQSKTLVLQ